MNAKHADEPEAAGSPSLPKDAAHPAHGRPGEPMDFQLFIQSVRDYAIFMLDPEGRVQTWNPGAERIKGYSREEIVGQHFSRFYTREDVDAGKPDALLAIAEAEGRCEDEGWRVKKDGSRFWASVVITAVRGDAGELVGFGKVTRDLTEHKRAEDTRLRLAHAQEAVRLRDDFLSVAAHELRTPLTALELQVQRLGEVPLTGQAKALADRARRSTTRLALLVEALLDLARITAGRLELVHDRFELGAAVRDVVDRLAGPATAAGAPIRVSAGGPVVGRWDRLRVEQVVMNLLSNALKYGGNEPIEVEIGREGGEATIAVRDHGPGIAEQDLERIFLRFERAASARSYGGLGLGLYLAREIVEAHGGTIRAESRRGAGARFVVRLPIDPPAREEEAR